MSRVYTFGETVYDIIFKEGQPVAAKAGGAMLNTAVSLGRCGQPVSLISEIGDDLVGRFVRDFLNGNDVDTTCLVNYSGHKTAVALAFLDGNGTAEYSFYKEYPRERLTQEFPQPGKGDIVLFGSFYSLNQKIRPKLREFIMSARENGAIIIYDPNIRKNHMHELGELFHFVLENISLAHVVRGSHEDFDNLFNCCEKEKVFAQVKELGCRFLIITHSDKGVELISDGIQVTSEVKKTKVVSTIGAGDTFNAGIIHGLLENLGQDKTLETLDKASWKKILATGTAFAADACSSYDNYVSVKFGESRKLA